MEQHISIEPKKSVGTLSALAKDTRGAGLVEYIVLVGLIALTAVMGFEAFGTAVNERATSLGSTVSSIGN